MHGFLEEFAAGADETLVHEELFGERLHVDEHADDRRGKVTIILAFWSFLFR